LLRQWGFTFVELLTAIAVMAVLAAIAVPSFRSTIAGNRLVTTTGGYIAAIKQARSEAIRRNASVQFCGSSATANGADTLGTACGIDAGHVYALDANGSAATKVTDVPPLPAHISIDNNGGDVPALRYGGQGLAHMLSSNSPYSGLVADVTSDQLPTDNHRCIYIVSGSSVRSCVSSTSCPTSEPSNCK
jgi:type IV fimbrial biogenesis protein FimT